MFCQLVNCTWLSCGRNATLISFSVLMCLAAVDLHNLENSSSGQAAKNKHRTQKQKKPRQVNNIQPIPGYEYPNISAHSSTILIIYNNHLQRLKETFFWTFATPPYNITWCTIRTYGNWYFCCNICHINSLLTFRSRDFSVVGPSIWNRLPLGLCLSPHSDLPKFYKLLKSFFCGHG